MFRIAGDTDISTRIADLAALSVRAVVQDPHTGNVVLWVAIAGASMPLLIFLVQQLSKGNFIVDKTGTLTYGRPSLTEVQCFGGIKRETALQYVASLEQYSKHPLASAVLAAAKAEGLPFLEVEDVSEAPVRA